MSHRFRIAIVDDSPRIDVLCDELSLLGNIAERFCDIDSVAEQLRSFRPDALVLDCMMPIMMDVDGSEGGCLSGILLYEQVLHKATLGVPVVLLTALNPYTSLAAEAERRMLVYDEYRGLIGKPCDAEDVLAVLEPSSCEQETS